MSKILILFVFAISTVGALSVGHAEPRKAPGISVDKETGEKEEPTDPQPESADPDSSNYDDSLLIVDDTQERDSNCDSFLLH